MEQYVIRGGNPLVGEVEIGGAKNGIPLNKAYVFCNSYGSNDDR